MSGIITLEQVRSIAKGEPKKANARSVVIALNKFGAAVGLDQPHRLVHFIAQVCHESESFRHDGEIWGPTAAQKRYEGRRDLGNTRKGDGFRYRGRTAMMLTGRANYRSFTAWARKLDPSAPDFEADPELVNTDPWEGLVPLWYWDAGNPEHRSLNRYADDNNHEMVTRRINGGLNGYEDRLDYLARASLVMLGYAPNAVRRFQEAMGIGADGIVGNVTRSSMHSALLRLSKPRPFEPKPAAPNLPLDPGEAAKRTEDDLLAEQIRKETDSSAPGGDQSSNIIVETPTVPPSATAEQEEMAKRPGGVTVKPEKGGNPLMPIVIVLGLAAGGIAAAWNSIIEAAKGFLQ